MAKDHKKNSGWRMQTLEQLENDIWPKIRDSTFLVATCHALRKKPIIDFDIEDLRVMISQNFGIPFLIPVAIDKLEADLFVEGNFYPGDLFSAILEIDPIYWIGEDESIQRITEIADQNKEKLKNEFESLHFKYIDWLQLMD